MIAYTPPLKDIRFVLNDVLDAPSALACLRDEAASSELFIG